MLDGIFYTYIYIYISLASRITLMKYKINSKEIFGRETFGKMAL